MIAIRNKIRFRFSHYLIKWAYILIDILAVYAAFYFTCVLRHRTLPFDVTWFGLLLDQSNPFRSVFWIWMTTAIFCANANRLYQTRREIFEGVEVWAVVKCALISSVVVIVTIYSLKIEGFPRSVLVGVTLSMAAFMSAWRVVKKFFVEYLVTMGYNNFNVLIIGAGKVGTALSEEIERRPGYGLKIVGYLDDYKSTEETGNGHPVLGPISDFAQIARREFINKVFITVHHDSRVFLDLLEQARKLKIAVRVIPQGYYLASHDFCTYNIGFIPVIEYCEEEHRIKQFGKRLFDFTFGAALTLLLSPVLLFLAVLVKLDSPGPVFFLSQRYGCRGRKFRMLKFRSMVHGADGEMVKIREQNEVDGPIFKIRNDPRVTRLGRILRKYSLDELPQLFNVLHGDMSLVGPRPLPIDQIEKEDLRQLKRLDVRPGITGLWQIRGRSDISFTRLVKWDIWYINNWSFWLDLNILLQTLPVVFKGRGAY